MYPLAVAGALVALGDPDRHRLVRPEVVVLGGAVALALMSPLSPRAPAPVSLQSLTEFRTDRADAVARADIGPDDSVVANVGILAHLTHRTEAWRFPAPYAAADPAELSPTPSKAAAARVDVVIVEGDDAVREARRHGLEGDVEDGILIARP
jgi:hypothetical protein